MDLLKSPGHSGSWRGVRRPNPGELVISELFGPTLQGEGPSAGRSAYFVRLGFCNLACSWCDTGYTWDKAHFDLSATLQVVARSTVERLVTASTAQLVIITGGEPALQADELTQLACQLRHKGHRVELETNGTIPLGPLIDHLDLVVVSPKLANSNLRFHQRIRNAVLRDLSSAPNTIFKFVAQCVQDLVEIDAIVDELCVQDHRVWVMPEARDRTELTRRLAELAQPVADRGWSLSNRLHILLWGDERGR